MSEDKMVYAKDYKCCVCGKQAEVFWPVMDPDIPSHPYCKECVKEEQMKLLIEFHKIDEKLAKESEKHTCGQCGHFMRYVRFDGTPDHDGDCGSIQMNKECYEGKNPFINEEIPILQVDAKDDACGLFRTTRTSRVSKYIKAHPDLYIQTKKIERKNNENKITINCYIARDEDGTLAVFGEAPQRTTYNDQRNWWISPYGRIDLNNHLFPEVEWEDEPMKSTITIKPQKQ